MKVKKRLPSAHRNHNNHQSMKNTENSAAHIYKECKPKYVLLIHFLQLGQFRFKSVSHCKLQFIWRQIENRLFRHSLTSCVGPHLSGLLCCHLPKDPHKEPKHTKVHFKWTKDCIWESTLMFLCQWPKACEFKRQLLEQGPDLLSYMLKMNPHF